MEMADKIVCVVPEICPPACRGEILTFPHPRHSHYSGVIPMVFEHSACASLYSLAPPARTVCVSPLWMNFYFSEDHHGTGRSGHGRVHTLQTEL